MVKISSIFVAFLENMNFNGFKCILLFQQIQDLIPTDNKAVPWITWAELWGQNDDEI